MPSSLIIKPYYNSDLLMTSLVFAGRVKGSCWQSYIVCFIVSLNPRNTLYYWKFKRPLFYQHPRLLFDLPFLIIYRWLLGRNFLPALPRLYLLSPPSSVFGSFEMKSRLFWPIRVSFSQRDYTSGNFKLCLVESDEEFTEGNWNWSVPKIYEYDFTVKLVYVGLLRN